MKQTIETMRGDIATVIDTADMLINDVIVYVHTDEESESYNLKLKALHRVQGLLRAAPDLVAVLAGLLACPDLNLDDMDESTFDLCAKAYDVLSAALGIENPANLIVLSELASQLDMREYANAS